VAVVSEAGKFLGEEQGLALATRHILARRADIAGPVVINMSTSRVTEDVALAAKRRVIRTAVGEINVAERMKAEGAVFGGEGNGGIMDPRLHYARDGLMGIAHFLEMLALSGRGVGALAAELPSYVMLKTKVQLPPARGREVVPRLADRAADARVNTEDGLRFDWDDRWVHLRASNTEPILRIIAEARTAEAAEALVRDMTARVRELTAT